MATDITKEEINALMTVQSKAVEQQVLIAERLKAIADIQEKICDRLSNGLSKEITEQIKESLKPVKEDVKVIKDSIGWLKVLYAVLALVVAISAVIFKVIL